MEVTRGFYRDILTRVQCSPMHRGAECAARTLRFRAVEPSVEAAVHRAAQACPVQLHYSMSSAINRRVYVAPSRTFRKRFSLSMRVRPTACRLAEECHVGTEQPSYLRLYGATRSTGVS
jgi:hypothetical protein